MTPALDIIRFVSVSKCFRTEGRGEVWAIRDFNLNCAEGELTCVLGPSGCGKTTLLNILAGLIPWDAGHVELDGRISCVFQEPRLLPWLDVRRNVALVLEEKLPADGVRETVSRHLELTGMTEYAGYYPSQLSGGLKQRAALARAFAFPAEILLMDEPFKSLDFQARRRLIRDFLALWRCEVRTVVFVTHDIREALWMGDLVVLLSDKPVLVLRKHTISIPQEERWGHPQISGLEETWLKEFGGE